MTVVRGVGARVEFEARTIVEQESSAVRARDDVRQVIEDPDYEARRKALAVELRARLERATKTRRGVVLSREEADRLIGIVVACAEHADSIRMYIRWREESEAAWHLERRRFDAALRKLAALVFDFDGRFVLHSDGSGFLARVFGRYTYRIVHRYVDRVLEWAGTERRAYPKAQLHELDQVIGKEAFAAAYGIAGDEALDVGPEDTLVSSRPQVTFTPAI